VSAGFVYVMSNSAMPKLIKVGRTSKSPELRAEELWTTGVPAPFKVEFAIFASDSVALERECHERFAEWRYQTNREFFCLYPFVVAKFIVERCDVLCEFALVSKEEDSALTEIGQVMNAVTPHHMHPFEVAAALELLTPDELRMLALRYQAHVDQATARVAEVGGEAGQ